MSDKKWPEATNYEEAGRLSGAYRESMSHLLELDANTTLTADEWRHAVFQQRNAEGLLLLAQVHATLAVADELRQTREHTRYNAAIFGPARF